MSINRKVKSISKQEALAKAMRYCAYQERCHYEVSTKLSNLALDNSVIEEVMAKLIEEGFLNEERYAKVFAEGKFHLKKWGKLKIQKALVDKRVSETCISRGLDEIPEQDYHDTLEELIRKKGPEIKSSNDYQWKHKLATFVIRKGYEPELVWNMVRSIDH